MKFKVYNKGGSMKDALMSFDADSLERAIDFASQIKKMSIDSFLKIFVVKEVK
jgi:hypothetical protein